MSIYCGKRELQAVVFSLHSLAIYLEPFRRPRGLMSWEDLAPMQSGQKLLQVSWRGGAGRGDGEGGAVVKSYSEGRAPESRRVHGEGPKCWGTWDHVFR